MLLFGSLHAKCHFYCLMLNKNNYIKLETVETTRCCILAQYIPFPLMLLLPPLASLLKHNTTQKLPADDVDRPLYLFFY